MYMITVWYESIRRKNKKWIKLDRTLLVQIMHIYIHICSFYSLRLDKTRVKSLWNQKFYLFGIM